MTALNTICAESLDYCATALESAISKGKTLNAAITDLLATIIKEDGAVVFNGNGYSQEWHTEAEKRGLPNLKATVNALPVYNSKEVIELFDKYKVLTPRELHSRYEIAYEQYVKTVSVEARLVLSIALTRLLPGITKYQHDVATTLHSLKTLGIAADTKLLEKITTLTNKFEEKIDALDKIFSAHAGSTVVEEANYISDKVLPAMKDVRDVADTLEGLVAHDRWALPTYEDMLFVK